MPPVPKLTVRETEVVKLVARGLTNTQIASLLHVSGRTVQSHVEAALKKTGTANRVQLAVYAVRVGLVPMEHPEDTAG
jgi:DNA-binding NarL/FixJ family response regulator